MKKSIFLLVLSISGMCGSFAQKKENGTVYIDHPAINMVAEFIKASVSGEEAKIASFLTDDFKSYNGTSTVFNDKGTAKAAFVKNTMRYPKELDYFSIETLPGAYADAVEYKKDNKDGEVWVQDWSLLKGVHKATGVKMNSATHRLYKLTKDYKIKTIINYSNAVILNEVGSSFANRTNGKIYNHHENINTIRKSMYAFEKADIDKALSFFSDDATFSDINMEAGKSLSKTEIKVVWKKFLDDYEIQSIDMVGYPDYLEYEMDNGREVLSWWKYNLIRKSDKKTLVIPMHFSDSFDADGKITAEMAYFSDSLMAKNK
ncbi:hypothetical protein PBAL39_02017 [Pedobacter sp. BAL39]|uniref:nuclear transport factor 2 family protein n=1 Tax=Pedobacter sp. BAL39 TaxID=391596 RepID=UPI0001559C92|nr:hypothetical protein [Pedobacter sp. BAL39]EDM38352.1 hypothetical protein PBAL39_02017 [Pedobacter sp. BAL39]